MQEDIRNENTPDAPAPSRRRIAGRTRVIIAAVALAGIGLGGAALAATGNDEPAVPAAAVDTQARAEAAERADRSARESDAPAGPPTAGPTPSATTASPTPKPSPKATTAKPKPKPKPKPTSASKPKSGWVIPMKGAAITSCYGPRWGTQHAGIDFALPAGTAVHAAFGGTVTKAGDVGDGYGISVVVDHGNGYLTHYAHLSTAKVGVGATVTTGQTIGLEGSTGDSTGPHLHFEVHQDQMWNQIDPAPFLRARGIDVAC
ncbi:M23 family metallopeptidase [Micromonospora sp. KLBMP9576]|uniref:M23 family metallopeptidase n=1 Tax=Micromonospora sp. KLBMP9576 TaxID=3424769 RepID=UPI003D8FE905